MANTNKPHAEKGIEGSEIQERKEKQEERKLKEKITHRVSRPLTILGIRNTSTMAICKA